MKDISETSSRPLFSIIVTVYDASRYLVRCVDSILEQTFKDYELILIDDHSTDDSLDICRSYEKQDDRVRVAALEKNGGIVNARDVSLQMAEGEYIIFVDADDCYTSSSRLEVIADEILKNSPDIVCTGYTVGPEGSKGKKILNSLPCGYYPSSEYSALREKIFSFNDKGTDRWIFPSVWSKAIKKELYDVTVGIVDKKLRMGEDAARTYVALGLADSISVIDESSYFYYQYPVQMTKGYHKGYYEASIGNYLNIGKILKEQNPSGNYDAAVKANICHVSAYAVLNEGRNPDRVNAKKIIESICSNKVVIDANKDQRKSVNPFYRYLLSLMEKKSYGRIAFIAKLYCLFMQ